MSHPSRDRLQRVARAMDAQGIDVLVLTPGASMFYLSGFEHGHAAERLLALIIRRDGTTSWIVPAMNVPQVAAHALPEQTIRSWSDGEGFLPALKDAVGGAKQVAFDDEARASFLMDLRELAPQAHIAKASTIMRTLRMRKDVDELVRLRMAGKVVDDAIPLAVALCRAGQRESD